MKRSRDLGLKFHEVELSPPPMDLRETESSQNSPLISMGKTRLRGRHTESLIKFVFGPVEKFISTLCQELVPVVEAVDA